MKPNLSQSILALLSICASCLPAYATTTVVDGPYTTTVDTSPPGSGLTSSEAISYDGADRANGFYTGAFVQALGNGSVIGVTSASAYAEAETVLHVSGGTAGADVTVTIHWALEIFGNKSAENSISSANALIDITDVADPNTIIWEQELDLHLTDGGGSSFSQSGDIDALQSSTVTLKSGHSYYVALESFAEATAYTVDDGNGGLTSGWANAEAEADPTFSIVGPNPNGYGLNHVVTSGGSIQSVPEPSSAILLSLATFGLVARRSRLLR